LAAGFGAAVLAVSGHLDLPGDGREASAMATTNSDQVHW
jgi:hypothetical protein